MRLYCNCCRTENWRAAILIAFYVCKAICQRAERLSDFDEGRRGSPLLLQNVSIMVAMNENTASITPLRITAPCHILRHNHDNFTILQVRIDWNRSVPTSVSATPAYRCKTNLDGVTQNTKHTEKVSQYVIALSTLT